jgi:hypothetical protein
MYALEKQSIVNSRGQAEGTTEKGAKIEFAAEVDLAHVRDDQFCGQAFFSENAAGILNQTGHHINACDGIAPASQESRLVSAGASKVKYACPRPQE